MSEEERDSHEWMRRDGTSVTVGITKKACRALGEIVFVGLPAVGQRVTSGEEVVVLESTKAAVDSYAPITGEVIAINHELLENPHLINTEPETSGWLYVLRVHE